MLHCAPQICEISLAYLAGSSSVDASNESDSEITSYGTTTPDFYAPFTGRVLSPKEQFFCDSKPREFPNTMLLCLTSCFLFAIL